ncbi:hypothetical protein FKP32DRAFT_1574922 [Trametes sanguinea]|nr:hypothetical protein FKP32DRAFT_1574922 [Trametes sanguinea]
MNSPIPSTGPDVLSASECRDTDEGRSADQGTSARDDAYDFEIAVVDLQTLASTARIRRRADQTTVVALAQQGYMATSPISPTLAVSFNTLELFHRLRLRKPSLSVEAFAKVICDYYAIPYRRRYRNALSDAFDVYLQILRAVDRQVKAVLKRDTPDWRVKNACPACCYELEGEPPLKFKRMWAMDGNNSLKRIAKFGDRQVADTRVFTESDYYLSRAFVDRFKDEVRSHRGDATAASRAAGEEEWSDIEDDDEPDESGTVDIEFVEDPADDFRQCTKNWKSAARDETKRMWGIFDETGIFASACRHGFILWIVDMVCSGELAKYALAIIAMALVTLGPRSAIGYDIGCSFCGTIARSSLGPEFKRLGYRCCVNAFHGYSHSHRCQTQHHPSVIEGAGLEDWETMERVFSESNQLAVITRYASAYHRHVAIDMHFKQWDEQKYANLATMLLNNYRQALGILSDEASLLDEGLRELGYTRQQLQEWQDEEKTYFATLGEEDPANAAAVEYVSLLRALGDAEARLGKAMDTFVMSIPEDYSYAPPSSSTSNPAYYAEASRTRKKETERRVLREKRDNLLRDIVALEIKMGVDVRWRPDMKEYAETLKYIAERDYRAALDDLHRLVVQRLFELHTLNVSQTAYKVRTYIAKSLQRRSKAIRTAVAKYNAAAVKLTPPRPTLDWSKVTHYTFIEEFELLRDTRNDIRDHPWARSDVRELMKKARRVARAQEEIIRCNVEVRRLHTSIVDENRELDTILGTLRSQKDPVWPAVQEYAIRRKRVNARLLAVISQIYDLPGFTGERAPGTKLGAPRGASQSSRSAMDEVVEAEKEELAQDQAEDDFDDVELQEATRVFDFAANIL